MTDNDLESNKAVIDSDIAKIQAQNKPLVFPKDGFGTGLAKLKEKAPQTYAYLKQRLLEEFGFNNDTGAIVEGVAPRKKESKKPNKVKKTNMFTNMMNQGIPEDLIEDMIEDMKENVVEETSTTNMFEGLETSTDMSDLLEEMKAAEENLENTESEGELDLSLFENYQGASDNINNKTEDNPEDKSNKNEFKDKC